jgi:hypothetical protein
MADLERARGNGPGKLGWGMVVAGLLAGVSAFFGASLADKPTLLIPSRVDDVPTKELIAEIKRLRDSIDARDALMHKTARLDSPTQLPPREHSVLLEQENAQIKTDAHLLIENKASPCTGLGQVCSAKEDRIRNALELAFRQVANASPATEQTQGARVVQIDGEPSIPLLDDNGAELILGKGSTLVTEFFDSSRQSADVLATLVFEIGQQSLPLCSGTARVERRTWTGDLGQPGPLRILNPAGLHGVSVRYSWGRAKNGKEPGTEFETLVRQDAYRSLAERLFRQTSAQAVRLRKEPFEHAGVRVVLPIASWLRVYQQQGEWMEVKTQMGDEGWIRADLLQSPVPIDAIDSMASVSSATPANAVSTRVIDPQNAPL